MRIYVLFHSRTEDQRPRSRSRVWTWARCRTRPSAPTECQYNTRQELQGNHRFHQVKLDNKREERLFTASSVKLLKQTFFHSLDIWKIFERSQLRFTAECTEIITFVSRFLRLQRFFEKLQTLIVVRQSGVFRVLFGLHYVIQPAVRKKKTEYKSILTLLSGAKQIF